MDSSTPVNPTSVSQGPVTPSEPPSRTNPVQRCAVVLCLAGAALLGIVAMQDGSALGREGMVQGVQPSRSARLRLMLEQAPQLLAAENVRVEIDLGQRRLVVYRDLTPLQTFPIAVGKATWETPTGQFAVLDMRVDPVWRHPITGEQVPPGPDNPLGTRWIGFSIEGRHHLGIHGTNEDRLIGAAASHGCVRMLNADIQTLYSLTKIGTPVTVVP